MDYNKWKTKMYNDGYDKIIKTFGDLKIESILNIGLGGDKGNPSIRWLRFFSEFLPSISNFVTLELFEDIIKKASGHKLIRNIVQGDVRKVDEYFDANSFDLIFWGMGPEHITREEWSDTFRRIELVASKLVIYHVPWGSGYNNDNGHLSKSIRKGEMEQFGYNGLYVGKEDSRHAAIRAWKIL